MAMWDASVAEIGAPPVKSAQREGTQRGLAKRPLAFAAALAVRWPYPDAGQDDPHSPDFARVFSGGAISHGTAFVSEGDAGFGRFHQPKIVNPESTDRFCSNAVYAKR